MEVLHLIASLRCVFFSSALDPVQRGQKSSQLAADMFGLLDQLPRGWSSWMDKHGQGYEIEFPIRVKKLLKWPPQRYIRAANGELEAGDRIGVEHIELDFLKVLTQ